MPDRLKTKRLILRLPEMREATDFMVLANNPRIAAMLARMPSPYRMADALAFLRRCRESPWRNDAAIFGIYTDAPRPELVGTCGFDPMPSDVVPHLGYWIGEPYWGKGYASEATRALLRYAFVERGLPQLLSGCRPDNHGSRAVLEKIGFRHVGSGWIYAASRKRTEPIDSFVLDAQDWRRMAQ